MRQKPECMETKLHHTSISATETSIFSPL